MRKGKVSEVSSDMKKILEVIEEKKPEIEAAIRKYAPRSYDYEATKSICGEPRYEYSPEAYNKALADPMWELLDRGGKRWRSVLFLLILEALDADMDKARDFVIIPELVHNGTLLIDDIEDDSELRRGKPAIHKIYGNDVAINAGNEMYYLALTVALRHREDFPAETLLKCYETYVQEMINIGFGQGADIAWHNSMANADSVSEEEYLQMCAFKTGTLARMSARIAALLAGAPNGTVEALGHFAESIGVGFQIQDDLLNLTAESDSAQFVKEYIGSDISEGKRTLMVIHAMKHGGPAAGKRLVEILNMHTRDRALIDEAIAILQNAGSVDYAKNRAREIVQNAWAHADKALPDSESKQKIKWFADYLIEREF